MKKYAIGIDLGTTNSVVAFRNMDDAEAGVELLPIPQITAPGTVESKNELPSFLYIPLENEKTEGTYSLPWDTDPAYVVGTWARKQSADNPIRTVAAAKSWLCYNKVDRKDAILPWNAPEDIAKISPLDATRIYLSHMVDAWNDAHNDESFADQQVVLTVPASFDVSARELTHEAALAAGFPTDFVLLEEPQAAVYAWLADVGDDWRKNLDEGDSLLVCDVGGGTTDFTLVQIASEEGDLQLQRVAVGDHILVGGDNMDLTLAHYAREAFAEKGTEVDAWQSVALWHSCRSAKESLLTEGGDTTFPVTVLGRGSKLIGGSISVDLNRDEITQLLIDGFAPECALSDRPARRMASGFRELGLPFESDAAITRHLASFLSSHGADGQPAKPTHVLFNGGVLKSNALRDKVLSVLQSWYSGSQIQQITSNKDLDYAVARGAAFYGFTKQSGGIRIRGGTAHAYYIGIETAGLAIPGAPRPLKALCVVPCGMEEGTACQVPGGDIGLVVGEPVKFRFFSSNTRKEDVAGALLPRWNSNELEESDSMEATLPKSEKVDDEFVPVTFESRITELGMFELWCVSTVSDDKWKLEFSVREDA